MFEERKKLIKFIISNLNVFKLDRKILNDYEYCLISEALTKHYESMPIKKLRNLNREIKCQ